MLNKATVLLGALAATAFAATDIDLFVGPDAVNAQFVASVMDVKDCTTVLGVVCTAGSTIVSAISIPCDTAVTATVTMAPGTYEVASATSIDGESKVALTACALSGTTEAICSETTNVDKTGSSTAHSGTLTFTGAEVVFATVPVTAGESLLSSCTASSGAGKSTSKSSSSSTGVSKSSVSSSSSITTQVPIPVESSSTSSTTTSFPGGPGPVSHASSSPATTSPTSSSMPTPASGNAAAPTGVIDVVKVLVPAAALVAGVVL